MLARGVRGNPWLFHQIHTYQDSGILEPKPTWQEQKAMILRHARMQTENRGELMGMRHMRKHIAWYTAGYKNSSALRRQANTIETYCELEELLENAPLN